MSIDMIVVGEWSPYHHLSKKDKVVFDEAVDGLIGADYTPIAVATQIKVGQSYRYRCDAQTHDLAHTHWLSVVEIFNPEKGGAYIESIQKVDD